MLYNQKSTILTFVLLIIGFSAFSQITRPIGINLTGIVDYSSEYVFVDVFNQTREWIPHDIASGSDWSSDVNIPLGANGYPLEIPYDDGINSAQGIRTLMYFGNLEGHYPNGKYRLIASGTGEIFLWGAASGRFSCPVDTLVNVNSELGGIALEITSSLSTDPIHDIHFVMPDFENTYTSNPFNPDLLNFIEDFQVLRFMDWTSTNGSPIHEWADRNSPDYYTQTLGNGIAYEYIVDICNTNQKDAWICIPHAASDDYISQLAIFFRDKLDSSLKLYIEYSNEVWNSGFSQNQYAAEKATELGYIGQPWEKSWQYYAKRTADVFHLFENEFDDNNRLIKVISSQAANPWVTNYIIEHFNDATYNPSQVKADAVAIAPYFGGSVADNIGARGQENSITVDEILDGMEASMSETFSWIDETKVVADNYNLDFLTYEGGQHLVAGWEYRDNDAFTAKLTSANRNPRMEAMHCDYFNYWYNNAQGGMFCYFSSHSVYGKYGSWGIKEFMDDIESPKYLGLKNCVFSQNNIISAVNNPESKGSNLKAFPIPSYKNIITVEHDMKNPHIYLIDAKGQEIPFKVIDKNDTSFKINVSDFKGFGMVIFDDGINVVTKKIIVH